MAGLAAFVLPLLLYVQTLAPTVTLEDSGEFITGAYWLGVVHAPGYPLWCLLVHPFTWLPWGTIAERVHLASAVFGAATTWLLFLCALRVFRDVRAALAGALVLGGSTILWSQSVVAEVYSLNAMLSVLLLYLALRWKESGAAAWLYGLAFSVGLSMTNHHLAGLVALPIFLWLLTVDPRAIFDVRTVVVGAALLVVGLSVYLYLPIRALAEPPLNVGNPRTIERVIAHLGRAVYAADTEVGRTSGDLHDLVAHTLAAWTGTVRAFGWPAMLVAFLGVVTWPRASRDVLLLSFAILLLNTLVLNWVMAAPYTPYWEYVHRVYYIATNAMVALWFASGCRFLFGRFDALGCAGAVASVALVVLVLSFTVWASYPFAHRQGDYRARALALDVLDSAPPNAGFFPAGDDVIYPVLHARWVESMRPDVNLISPQYGWHGAPYTVLLAGDPLTEQMRKDIPALREFVSVPRGIVYAWVPKDAAPAADDYGAFVPLPGEPRDIQLDWPKTPGDVFHTDLHARYAAYFARLGARSLSRGDRESAMAYFDQAEALNPGDAYVDVLLFEIYRHFDLRCARRVALLHQARRDYLATFDPYGSRYAPVDLANIDAYLADAGNECGEPPPTGPSP